MYGLSVIVPVLNEIEALPSLTANLELLCAEQLIVVDGGSTDGSCQWLEENWQSDQSQQTRLILKSSAGRAQQMNLGSEVASHQMLLFLHADTRLPKNAKSLICDSDGEELWGRFDVQFDLSNKVMNVIAFGMNLRSRISSVATGDQAIFVHRSLFERVAGYDDLCLMEDVALSKKLRKLSKPLNLTAKVTTSARRWQHNGVINTVLTMWWYRMLFFLSVSPDKFVDKYHNIR